MCCKQFITHIILAAAEGLWHLGWLFYHYIQYSQRWWYITNFLLYDIPRNKTPRTGPHHIWRTVLFLWPREEHKRQISWVDFAGQCMLWLLLLRLAVLVVIVVVVVLLLLLPQNSFLTSLAFAPDSQSLSATKISRMASSSSLFFWPLLETHNRLPCMDCCVWLGTVSERNMSEIWTSSTVTTKQI